MGLTNKLVTKARTAAKSESVQLPRPWEDAGYLSAAALVRAVVATLARQELTSSGSVGRDSFGMKSGRLATASTIWAHQDGMGRWLIALGKDTVTGPIYDWQVRLTVTDNVAIQTATVETLSFIANDGTLLNKDSHGELRNLLLTNLSTGRTPTGRAEGELSRASLPAATPAPHAQLALEASLNSTITTTLSIADIDRRLHLLPFHRDGTAPDSRRWTLIPGSARAEDLLSAVIEDTGPNRQIQLTCQLAPTDNQVRDNRAAERAYALPRSVLAIIKAADSGASLTSVSSTLT